jgi:hypothetical protein
VLWGDINRAFPLVSGNLLAISLAKNICFQVDPESGVATFLFSVVWGPRTFFWRAVADRHGEIYLTASGTVTDTQPQAARFGYWGAVGSLSHRHGGIVTVVDTSMDPRVVDPHGIQILADGRMLVSDFVGFGGTGRIYIVHGRTGSIEVLADGGLLTTPVNAIRDDDGFIWVANADMSEGNDGEILRIDPDGRQSVLLPMSGRNSGQIVGMLQHPDKDYLIVFRCDWPWMVHSAVLAVHKKTARTRVLFEGSAAHPKFYNTNGDIAGDMLWFGESVDKEILGYDLRKEEVVSRIDMRPYVGYQRGMVDSYDGIESVTVIPPIVGNTL